MPGEHLNELATRTGPMLHGKANAAKNAWKSDGARLANVANSLKTVAPSVLEAFGADSQTGPAAQDAFTRAATRIQARADEMVAVGRKLEAVVEAMNAARVAAADSPPRPADKAPEQRPRTGDATTDLVGLIRHIAEANDYRAEVAAYGAADEEARLKIEALKNRYAEAVTALAVVHGDPHIPITEPDPRGGSGSGPPGGLGGHGSSVAVASPHPGVLGGHAPTGGLPGPGPASPFNIGPGGEVHGNLPGATTSGPSGGGPAVLGGLAVGAGLAGGPGLFRGVRNLLAGRGFGSTPGAIGSTTRAGGPGTLGRGNTVTPGGQVNRTAGRGGAGGGRARAGGTAGTAGSRRTGNRAAAGPGGAGRGSKRGKGSDDNGRNRNLFDDGAEWLDDEGTAPAVLD